MCGLLGYIGRTKPNKRVIQLLGLLNESRGTHSAGIYTILKDKAHFIKKVDAFRVLLEEEYSLGNIVIGHTRSASIGLKTLENAHPFGFSRHGEEVRLNYDNPGLTMAHNGTVTNYYDLKKDADLPMEFTTDSQILGGIMAKEQNFDVFTKYKGAAAMLISDNKKMYAWKGAAGGKEERPLHYTPRMYKGEIIGYYFSSLYEHLMIACQVPFEDIFQVPDNTIMVFEGNEITNMKTYARDETLTRDYRKPYVPTHNYHAPTKHVSPRRSLSLPSGMEELRGKLTKFTSYWKEGKGEIRIDETLRYKRNGHYVTGTFIIDNLRHSFLAGYRVSKFFYDDYSGKKIKESTLRFNALDCTMTETKDKVMKVGLLFNGTHQFVCGASLASHYGRVWETTIPGEDEEIDEEEYYGLFNH